MEGQAVLSVVKASSVFRNDMDKWGPEQALTNISSDWKNYWHSAEEDINPSITFEMQQEQEIFSVEVVDRQDCCHDRYKSVEVRVGTTPSFDEARTCGIQSYAGQTKYK